VPEIEHGVSDLAKQLELLVSGSSNALFSSLAISFDTAAVSEGDTLLVRVQDTNLHRSNEQTSKSRPVRAEFTAPSSAFTSLSRQVFASVSEGDVLSWRDDWPNHRE
jgi:hypothetical protein